MFSFVSRLNETVVSTNCEAQLRQMIIKKKLGEREGARTLAPVKKQNKKHRNGAKQRRTKRKTRNKLIIFMHIFGQ